MPVAALGLWGLLGGAYGPTEKYENVLTEAVDKYDFFDTAPYWGNDRIAERILGKAISTRSEAEVIGRLDITATQALHSKSVHAFRLARESLYLTLSNLNREFLDYLVVPLSKDFENDSFLVETLARLQSAGLIAHWGVSCERLDIDRLFAIEPEFFLTSVHLFHVAPLEMWADDERLKEIALWGHSPLLYGMLAHHWAENHTFPTNDHRSQRWSRESFTIRVRQVERLQTLLDAETQSLVELAYTFLQAQSSLDLVIGGPRSDTQSQAFLAAMQRPMPIAPTKLDAIERICVTAMTE